MFDWRSSTEWWQLFRYYQAGVVNLVFGYVLFAILIFFGLQVYVAQLVGHVIGVAFNYFTYSRYAFARQEASKFAFLLSYAGNYFIGLSGLWVTLRFVPSPYVAGLVATLFVSLLNFFVLKKLVFRKAPAN